MFILTSDWHLRNTRPRCRLDSDWIQMQRKALDQIASYAGDKREHVVCVGDIFHSVSDTTPEIIGLVQEFALKLESFGKSFFILAGNHDLPSHSLENMSRSAFSNLLNSKNIFHLKKMFTSGAASASDFGEDDHDRSIVFKHILCFPEKVKLPPNVKAVKPSMLLDQFPSAELICLGDYHHSFIHEQGGRSVLNPGCIIRQAADLKDYEPSVMHVIKRHDSYEVEKLPIVDPGEVVTDLYLVKEAEREGRISAFIDGLKYTGNIKLDFLENVYSRLETSDLDSGVKEKVLEFIGG
jgi:predicted phosphodiesterase